MVQAIQQPAVENEVVSAGVDWITATAKSGSTRWSMEEFARREFERVKDAGQDVKLASRLGYSGYAAPHFFHGRREGSSIIVASSHAAWNCWRSIASVADNLARLDLQVTVATPSDRPHLARQAYQLLRSSPPASIRVRNCTLIDTHPKGETCNVGKRSSDQSGRIYDKASETKQGDSLSLWRYEVEFKRNLAGSVAACLRSSSSDEAVARTLVHRWFADRGLLPIFDPSPYSALRNSPPVATDRDTLEWFRASVSVSVARMIRKRGLVPVLEALRLDSLVIPICEKGE
jgi:hypothetical protein